MRCAAGGNAVDAAVAAVLMSFVAESPLTGPGAGGFMLVHTAGGEDHLLDFFVAAPGHRARRARAGRADADRRPLLRRRRPALQRRARRRAGPTAPRSASCEALRALRHDAAGRLSPRGPAARRARGRRGRADAGVPVQDPRARSCCLHARGRGDLRARRPPAPARATRIRLPELGDLLDRLGAEGPGFLYERRRGAADQRLGARARRPAHVATTSPPTRWSSASPARVTLPRPRACSPTRRRPRAGS